MAIDTFTKLMRVYWLGLLNDTSSMIIGLDPHGRVCYRSFGCGQICILGASHIYADKTLLATFDECDQRYIGSIAFLLD